MSAATEVTPFHPTHHVGKAAALALRLAEAENALHALTSGQVDAIIGPGGQTYLLRPAQEQLRQNEKRQQAVLESVADVLTVVNRAGVILSENHAVRRVLGYVPAELVGSVIFKLIHDKDMSTVYSAFVNVFEGYDETTTVRFRHLMRDGSYCLVEASLGKLRDVSPESVIFSLRPVNGSPAGVKPSVTGSADGQSPPDKDRFLAMLSHELRVPLTPVLFGIAELLADSLRLQQVMWNLVKNAVKFSTRGGSISIGSVNDASGGLIMEFADRGIGIVPELLPLVFDPLQQGDDSMQRRYGGLGLGLFIARGLAEAHQGTLTVTSEGRGHGATFRLSLKTITQTTQ